MKKRVVKVRVTGWPRTGVFSVYTTFILLKKADSVGWRARGVCAATPTQVDEALCLQDTRVVGIPGFPSHSFIPHGSLSFAILFSSFNSMILFSFGTVIKERRKKITTVATVKCLPTIRETQFQSLGGDDPLEKGMATHSSTLAWKIPWTEEPGRL